MEYQIFVEQQPHNGFVAKVLGWPELIATGHTKQEAMLNVRTVVEERLAHGEVLPLQIETPQIDPWEAMAGRFADDPTWDDFEAELKRIRAEANRD